MTGRDHGHSGLALAIVVAAVLPELFSSALPLVNLYPIVIYAVMALGASLNIGYGGQLSMAQPAVAGVAAYAVGLLSVHNGWGTWETLPIALGAGIVTSLIATAPALRLKGWYLALSTFFVVGIFPDLIGATQSWTGGESGLGPIPKLPLVNPDSYGEYLFILGCFAICFLAVKLVVNSDWGLLIRSLRHGDTAAASVGANVTLLKGQLAIASAVPVSLGGWLLAHQTGYIGPSQFGANLLLLLLAAVIVGGPATLWGSTIGVVIFESLSLLIGPFSPYNPLFLAGGLLLAALLFPHGISPTFRGYFYELLGRWAPDEPPPAPVADAKVSLEPPEIEAKSALSLHGVTKAYGGVAVLRGVDLSLSRGEVVGLVGPNGSGKTTLLNVISGFVRPDGGEMEICGHKARFGARHSIAAAGVRRTFQTPRLIDEVSLRQNIRLGLTGRGRIGLLPTPGRRRAKLEHEQRIDAVFELLGLDPALGDMPAGALPLGLRRIVEIGRAIVSQPSVVCLDEPAAGLEAEQLGHLRDALKSLAASGFAILLIEHNLDFVRGVCDSITVLVEGQAAQGEDAITFGRGTRRKRPPRVRPLGTGGPIPSPGAGAA